MTFITRDLEFVTNEYGCHLVVSHKPNKDGYIQAKRQGKTYLVHRLKYEEVNGRIPEGMVVRHKCDNTTCINPEHLEVGTHADNVKDKVQRGRQSKIPNPGEKNGASKLTDIQVLEIRADEHSTNVALAKRYGVTHQMISKIRKGYFWTHI